MNQIHDEHCCLISDHFVYATQVRSDRERHKNAIFRQYRTLQALSNVKRSNAVLIYEVKTGVRDSLNLFLLHISRAGYETDKIRDLRSKIFVYQRVLFVMRLKDEVPIQGNILSERKSSIIILPEHIADSDLRAKFVLKMERCFKSVVEDAAVIEAKK